MTQGSGVEVFCSVYRGLILNAVSRPDGRAGRAFVRIAAYILDLCNR